MRPVALSSLLALLACTPAYERDADGDGFSPALGDCDDEYSAINPLQTDIVGDDIDQNCDGVDGTDHDGDGVASLVSGGADCDDDEVGVFPEAPEVLGDGVDQDCNGADRAEESFTPEGPTAVDLLWVLDDSCSMDEEQDRLAKAIPALLDALDGSGLDWRMGVVTTDMEAFSKRGKLQADPDTGAKWFQATVGRDTVEDALDKAFRVGTGGAADEKGRAAARAALVTHADTDNAGFRREGAHLATAVLSDENDYSGANPRLDAFIDWYANEASPVGGASFHGIIGPPGGCATAWEPGADYAAVIDAVGGAETSICDADYGPFMDEMVGFMGGVFLLYPLASPAVEGTIQVFVSPPGGAEAELTAGWHYDAAQQAVVLDAAPPKGGTLRVQYDVAT